jgi:hypothetical protein
VSPAVRSGTARASWTWLRSGVRWPTRMPPRSARRDDRAALVRVSRAWLLSQIRRAARRRVVRPAEGCSWQVVFLAGRRHRGIDQDAIDVPHGHRGDFRHGVRWRGETGSPHPASKTSGTDEGRCARRSPDLGVGYAERVEVVGPRLGCCRPAIAKLPGRTRRCRPRPSRLAAALPPYRATARRRRGLPRHRRDTPRSTVYASTRSYHSRLRARSLTGSLI